MREAQGVRLKKAQGVSGKRAEIGLRMSEVRKHGIREPVLLTTGFPLHCNR